MERHPTSGSGWRPASPATSVARGPGSLCGALLVVLIGAAAWLHAADADAYYRLVQEDEAVEWATVWFLLIAAIGYGWRAWNAKGAPILAPLLLAAFCGLVAGEEISWGQRLLGYEPPAVFLEHNDQQELNLHNTLPKGLRKLALPGFLLGFGLALPLLACAPALRRRFEAFGLRAPGLGLAVGFCAAGGLYVAYPWRFTGEWVELLLGAALALHAFDADLRKLRTGTAEHALWLRPVLVFGVAAGLAVGASAWAREGREIDPQRVAAARLELEALRADFRRGRLASRCGLHKRLYRHAGEGTPLPAFRSLTRRGLSEQRAAFLLDPWNSPYWIRDHCAEDGSREVVIYSLGGNRLRESTWNTPAGDDLVLRVAGATTASR